MRSPTRTSRPASFRRSRDICSWSRRRARRPTTPPIRSRGGAIRSPARPSRFSVRAKRNSRPESFRASTTRRSAIYSIARTSLGNIIPGRPTPWPMRGSTSTTRFGTFVTDRTGRPTSFRRCRTCWPIFKTARSRRSPTSRRRGWRPIMPGRSATPGPVGSARSIWPSSKPRARPNTSCRYAGNTAIVLTWDDSGGWYDHVRPPAGPDGTTLGFRVPIVVISAWARSNYTPDNPHDMPYVSHTQRSTTAIVRFIEKNWALGTLGQRDASGDDLSDMFDYARPAPVPPMIYLAVRNVIHKTQWNLARSLHDSHAVDDDRITWVLRRCPPGSPGCGSRCWRRSPGPRRRPDTVLGSRSRFDIADGMRRRGTRRHALRDRKLAVRGDVGIGRPGRSQRRSGAFGRRVRRAARRRTLPARAANST